MLSPYSVWICAFAIFLFCAYAVWKYKDPARRRHMWWLEVFVVRVLSWKRQARNDVPQIFAGENTRSRRVLYGVAIGDAYGAGIEMQSREFIAQHVDFSSYLSVRHGRFAVAYVVGDYTDDTEMTLANVRFHYERICRGNENLSLADAYCDEFKRSRNWVGIGRQGHGSIEAYYHDRSQRVLEGIQRRQRRKSRPGNAPPMRALPLAFVTDDEQRLWSLCMENADISHPHDHARLASACVVFAARYLLLDHGNAKEVIGHCISKMRHPFVSSLGIEVEEFVQHLEMVDACFVRSDEPRNESAYRRVTASKWGMKCDSMLTAGCVLFVLKHWLHSPYDVLRHCCLLGGDVDSIASIALGIALGAAPHLNALPEWLYKPLQDINHLDSMAGMLHAITESEST